MQAWIGYCVVCSEGLLSAQCETCPPKLGIRGQAFRIQSTLPKLASLQQKSLLKPQCVHLTLVSTR
eukprot:scaffold1276_cov99-Cylindrotheca_fusiformis.AAC.2